MAVTATVIEYGGDEDLAIAGLLHDCAEDQGGKGRLRDIEHRFGRRVARIAEACSDSLADTHAGEEKPAWELRKQAYIEHLRSADRDVLQVSLADKGAEALRYFSDRKAGVLPGYVAPMQGGTPGYNRPAVSACLQLVGLSPSLP
jgi:(p)ppGpp synthase/HD superfamily hydrolase